MTLTAARQEDSDEWVTKRPNQSTGRKILMASFGTVTARVRFTLEVGESVTELDPDKVYLVQMNDIESMSVEALEGIIKGFKNLGLRVVFGASDITATEIAEAASRSGRPDLVDIPRVGDPDPWCQETYQDDQWCDRLAGHTGPHVAGDGHHVVAVWGGDGR